MPQTPPSPTKNLTEHRRHLLRGIFDAAVQAVAPDGAVLRHMHLQGTSLQVDGRSYELEGKKILVLGGGKGAAPMAQAVEKLLGDHIEEGLVVVKYQHDLPLQRVRLLQASHPVPDAAGVQATHAMLELAAKAGQQHLSLCLFTGGASALTPAPAAGLTLEDLQCSTHLLLECGATIHEINALRKHLSRFSGGQLARALAPSPVLSLIVSDVIGDNLDVIASGPTAPDPSSFAECAAIVQHYKLEGRLPASVWAHIQRGLRGQIPESPKDGDPIFDTVHNVLIATNAQALEAAAATARQWGFVPRILPAPLCGEARKQAVALVREARACADALPADAAPLCLLAGGETTVTLRGKGLGGRNQEMALAAALALEGEDSVLALFGGTDGSDGPTTAAGGYASGDSAARMRTHLHPEAHLQDNNSHPALNCCGDLLTTGPTRTNVMDVAILLVWPRP